MAQRRAQSIGLPCGARLNLKLNMPQKKCAETIEEAKTKFDKFTASIHKKFFCS
jgi:hypothetical protein